MFSQAAFSATPYSSILRIDAAVALTGVTTTGVVGSVSALPNTIAALTGVTTTGVVGDVRIWSQIVPNQNPSWVVINDSQTGTWTDVNDAQTPNWTQIAA